MYKASRCHIPLIIKLLCNITYTNSTLVIASRARFSFTHITLSIFILIPSTKKLHELPIMSLVATLLFKENKSFGTWIQTWAMNFPMALLYQLFYCGPLVRLIFRTIFREKKTNKQKQNQKIPFASKHQYYNYFYLLHLFCYLVLFTVFLLLLCHICYTIITYNDWRY